VNIKFEPQPNEPSRQQQQYHPGAMGGLRWVKAAGAVGGSVGGGWWAQWRSARKLTSALVARQRWKSRQILRIASA